MKHPLFLLLCLLFTISSYSQSDSAEVVKNEALKVFLDCSFCDGDFMRKEINYVNYVRDRMLADVHILATSQSTGSGGREYTFNFIGLKKFEGQENSMSVTVRADATEVERREARAKHLKFGLMPYVAQTPLVDDLVIEYKGVVDSIQVEEAVVDRWDYWVLRMEANGWFSGQELYKSKDLGANFSANRITEKWKIENWSNFSYNENSYVLDSVTTINNSNQSFYIESSAIRAINNHWSAGFIGTANSSTFRNIQFQFRANPAIEYNVFKYADFTRKQIRLQYRFTYNHFEYLDTTIYNQIQEGILSHSFSVSAEFTQPWGSISFSSRASQYLHDPSFRRLDLWASVSWRVAKGLSINAYGNIEFIRDQINLPLDGASDVDILTQQQQLATQYSYWGRLGFSYTFGSMYNNIVNPRFWN